MAWNRPSEGAAKPEPKKPSAMRGIVAGLVVVAVAAAVCYVLFSGDKAKKPVREDAKKGRIKAVTPAAAPTNTVVAKAPEKPVRRTKKGTIIPDCVQKDEHGIYRFPSGLRWVDTNNLHIIRHPQPRDLFRYRSENDIQTILSLDPTKMAPFFIGQRPEYGQRFVEDFKKSLQDVPITHDENDTPEEAELRKAVIETKKELAARMAAGEDIAKIMNDTQHELDRLCAYNEEIQKQLREIERDDKYSDDDVRDFVTAANMMLEKEGITKIAMPSLRTRQARLALNRQRRALEKKEEKKEEPHE